MSVFLKQNKAPACIHLHTQGLFTVIEAIVTVTVPVTGIGTGTVTVTVTVTVGVLLKQDLWSNCNCNCNCTHAYLGYICDKMLNTVMCEIDGLWFDACDTF